MPRSNDFLAALRAEVERQIEKRVTPVLDRLRALGDDLRNAQRELAGLRQGTPTAAAAKPRKTRKRGAKVAGTVRELRLSLGLSQAAFAQRIGVSLNSVGLWESGRTLPGPANVARINALRDAAGEDVPAVAPVRRGRKPGATKAATKSAGRKAAKSTKKRVTRRRSS